MKCHIQNKTWALVDLPEGSALVQCKWVFKVKLKSDNQTSFRARLVAKGFTQRKGINYNETFSLVVEHSTL